MRRFAIDKIKHWLRVLLHTQDSPQRTAVAFALGVFIAFLPPVPWFHTLFALLLAFTFRLNRLATLIGTYVNTPFTVLPLLAVEASVGILITGGKEPPEVTWHQLQSWQGWKDAFVELRPFVLPLMVGSIILGLLGFLFAYLIASRFILAYRRRLAWATQLAQAELELAAPVESPAAVIMDGRGVPSSSSSSSSAAVARSDPAGSHGGAGSADDQSGG